MIKAAKLAQQVQCQISGNLQVVVQPCLQRNPRSEYNFRPQSKPADKIPGEVIASSVGE